MFDWQNWLPGLNPELMWIVKVFFIALAITLVSFISKRVLRKMAAKVSNTQNRWDDVLLKALARPLTWVIWLEGLNIAADVIYIETQSAIFTYADSVREVGILICLTWFVLGIGYRQVTATGDNYYRGAGHTAESGLQHFRGSGNGRRWRYCRRLCGQGLAGQFFWWIDYLSGPALRGWRLDPFA